MKFRIRFADQIVGIFSIVAVAAIIFVIFMIGSKQRWFTKDPSFNTYFSSVSGLAEHMPILYKGFTIGNVKSFRLSDNDQVEVIFSIHEEYKNRVKEGSLVDLSVSPIGLGNQFLFYPGLGENEIEEGSYIPTVSSPQGQNFIQQKLTTVTAKSDSISDILAHVDELTRTLNGLLGDVQGAFAGSTDTSLGRSLNEVEKILADVNSIHRKLNEPDGLLYSALDTKGPVYTGLVQAIASLTGILSDIDKTTDVLPAQVPGLLMDVRRTIKQVDDILVALANNPLFKNGIPNQVQTQTSGTNPRQVEF